MPVKHAIWRVGDHPEPLAAATLANERNLEEMIVRAPRILSSEKMPTTPRRRSISSASNGSIRPLKARH